MLRTNLKGDTAEQLWSQYMQLTEAEAAFRALKSRLCARIRETANWRRLERFALPGIGGFRIPTLNDRSEAACRLRTAQSLRGLNTGMRGLYGGGWRVNPLCYGMFGAVWPFPERPRASPSHHPIGLAR